MSNTEQTVPLQEGVQLDHFTIIRRIGGGGFSVVYLATDNNSGEEVAIKEYLPYRLAYRDSDGVTICVREEGEKVQERFSHGRRLFFQEASFLATLKHPNVVNVTGFFRANQTVYMVMKYSVGVSLHSYIRKEKGGLSEALIYKVFLPLLGGLAMVHDKGMIHLDIKPANIYLNHDFNPVLLDFGAVHPMFQTRQYQPGQVVTVGFTPYEQSKIGGYVGPWSDLYAIGASMRCCITNDAPPSAEDRRMGDAEMRPMAESYKRRYSQRLLTAIDWALEVEPAVRPQSVAELVEALNREEVEESAGSSIGRMFDSLVGKLSRQESK
ncbi:MAG: serine/threonine protein kinase [Gammaproteobacteria bacterium]|nr:serine/threonine protein kinase [Gammaproteobacteria bacterium]